MKVLFISLSTYDIVGGIQAYNKKFLKALDCNKIDKKIISLHDKGNIDNNVIGCNSNIFKFILNLLVHSRFADVNVWAHINFSPVFVALRNIFKGKSILITHGVEVWYDDLPYMKKKSLNLYDKILTVSNYTKNKLVSVQGVPENKVGILANSIDISDQSGFKSPYNDKKFNLLTILRIDASDKLKSILNILDALVLLDDSNINFTIIGKGNKTDFIQHEICNRGLQEQVKMLGFVEDLKPYLEHCDLFTLISDKEGFGIVYLEAMEYRKPCLSAKNCGSSDVVVDGYNGYSIALDDIDYLATKIKELKSDDAKCQLFGDNGQQLLFDKFTFETYVETQINQLKDF